MKIVTNNYGCGTSSSILDYKISDVIIVSEENYDHAFEIDDDIFFVGHDFLMYLWDNKEKIERWKNHRHRKAVWCFERVDAIIEQWRLKSHHSINILKQFVDEVYACDESDCDKYGYEWFPQWASPLFFKKRNEVSINEKILFSGQAGIPEYETRNNLIKSIQDSELSDMFNFTNFKRSLVWKDYVQNLINHKYILNPFGVLRAFNVRSYEALYSGKLLIQQELGGEYKRHRELIDKNNNVILFSNKLELDKIRDYRYSEEETKVFYEENNIFSRFKKIGVDIK